MRHALHACLSPRPTCGAKDLVSYRAVLTNSSSSGSHCHWAPLAGLYWAQILVPAQAKGVGSIIISQANDCAESFAGHVPSWACAADLDCLCMSPQAAQREVRRLNMIRRPQACTVQSDARIMGIHKTLSLAGVRTRMTSGPAAALHDLM